MTNLTYNNIITQAREIASNVKPSLLVLGILDSGTETLTQNEERILTSFVTTYHKHLHKLNDSAKLSTRNATK